MKIIKRTDNNLVLFAGDDLALQAGMCSGKGWLFRNPEGIALMLEEVGSLPDSFVPNGWTHDAGTWTSNAIAEAHMSEEEKAEVPILITMRQARLALLAAGLLVTVNDFIATQSDEIKIYWEYSQELYRYHPVLMSLGSQLGLSDQQIDALFVAAGKL